MEKRFVIIYHMESNGRTETTVCSARNEATALIEFNVDNNKYGYYPIAIRELPEPFTSTKDLYL